MPKLAIYVRKDDMKLIEKWRKEINFSNIFLKALRREVRERDRPLAEDGNRAAAAAEFYRVRLSENSEMLVDYGYKLGADDVYECRLEPPVIQELLAIADREALSRDDLEKLASVNAARSRQIEQYGETHGFHDNTNPAWRHAVYSGYLQGVSDAWNRVCEEIRAN